MDLLIVCISGPKVTFTLYICKTRPHPSQIWTSLVGSFLSHLTISCPDPLGALTTVKHTRWDRWLSVVAMLTSYISKEKFSRGILQGSVLGPLVFPSAKDLRWILLPQLCWRYSTHPRHGYFWKCRPTSSSRHLFCKVSA